MTLPADARNPRIAAEVPCSDFWQRKWGWPCWDDEADRCPGCLGDGWRTVVTDVKIERTFVSPLVASGPMWREVPS